MLDFDAQLARIAASYPEPNRVRIFKLARDVDWWTWLCPKCLADWLAKGWQIRETKEPPHPLTCDCCAEGRAAA